MNKPQPTLEMQQLIDGVWGRESPEDFKLLRSLLHEVAKLRYKLTIALQKQPKNDQVKEAVAMADDILSNFTDNFLYETSEALPEDIVVYLTDLAKHAQKELDLKEGVLAATGHLLAGHTLQFLLAVRRAGEFENYLSGQGQHQQLLESSLRILGQANLFENKQTNYGSKTLACLLECLLLMAEFHTKLIGEGCVFQELITDSLNRLHLAEEKRLGHDHWIDKTPYDDLMTRCAAFTAGRKRARKPLPGSKKRGEWGKRRVKVADSMKGGETMLAFRNS